MRASFTSITSASLNFNSVPGEHGFLQATWANVRVESGLAPDPALAVPTDGLELWLRGDKGSNSDSSWQDLSPIGENATATALEPRRLRAFTTAPPVLPYTRSRVISFSTSTVRSTVKPDDDTASGQVGPAARDLVYLPELGHFLAGECALGQHVSIAVCGLCHLSFRHYAGEQRPGVYSSSDHRWRLFHHHVGPRRQRRLALCERREGTGESR